MYVADLANDVLGNFPHEALMNTVSSYEATYWLERISYNFLICNEMCKVFTCKSKNTVDGQQSTTVSACSQRHYMSENY